MVEDGDEDVGLAAPGRELPTLDVLPVPEAKGWRSWGRMPA